MQLKKTVKKDLDRIFSLYIRLRDGYMHNGKFVVKCPLCGKIVGWRNAQNMHFIKRSNLKYRYDEENCYAGCVGCNVYLNGNYQKYTLFMIDKFGIEKIEGMIYENGIHQIKEYQYREMIEEYVEKFNKLAETKNIDLYFKQTRNGSYQLKSGRFNTLGV